MQMTIPKPNTNRIILHLDYDCFYASVIEAHNPHLKGKPLAVQQKQIIVTCNYEARKRGLRKLQLISEAKTACPEVVIVLGEDLTLFRDASKELYQFIRAYSWNNRVETLGFDEVFFDATDIVDYNIALLNRGDLGSSFFHLSRDDPTLGFQYDASNAAGHTYPDHGAAALSYDVEEASLHSRLILGSHLLSFIRQEIENVKGYTSTGGIATTKVLSKLIGNVNKPRGQTTLMPPYYSTNQEISNVLQFMDSHEVGKVPGVGFKMAVLLREFVLKRKVELNEWILDDNDRVSVHTLRTLPGINEAVLEKVLSGTNSPKGIGLITWKIIHGADDAVVAMAKDAPKQLSIEDTYLKLTTFREVVIQLNKLTESLVRRMRLDLTEAVPGQPGDDTNPATNRQWIARPKTIRLSTRLRSAGRADGSRFNRASRSGPLPSFVFSFTDPADQIADKLTAEHLLPMFRLLHPQKTGWDLNLINVAVTNMLGMAGARASAGRNISNMFKHQDEILKPFRVAESNHSVVHTPSLDQGKEEKETPKEGQPSTLSTGSEDLVTLSQQSQKSARWEEDDSDDTETDDLELCHLCGAMMPMFAMAAHERFHNEG